MRIYITNIFICAEQTIRINKIRIIQLYQIDVKLTANQKKNLSNAFQNREIIALRLSKDALTGNDTLYLPSNVVKRLVPNRK